MIENMEVYNLKDPVTFPNGQTMTAKELKENERWGDMWKRPYVLVKNDEGVTTSYFLLDSLKKEYGIVTEDPQRALAEYKERRTAELEQARKDAELFDDSLATSMNAVAELGVHTATGLESAAELGTLAATGMEGTAELGATVAALEARIAALEAAKA